MFTRPVLKLYAVLEVVIRTILTVGLRSSHCQAIAGILRRVNSEHYHRRVIQAI